MKKITGIKQLLITTLLLGSMGLFSSCDGCSRTDGTGEGTEDGRDANGDTRGSETSTDNEGSGSTPGTNTKGGNSTDNSSASSGTSGSGSSGTGSRALTEEEITNQVENSNASRAVDANGDPIRSGGTSGTGQGTGTGSTGNNSKVTSREDQKS